MTTPFVHFSRTKHVVKRDILVLVRPHLHGHEEQDRRHSSLPAGVCLSVQCRELLRLVFVGSESDLDLQSPLLEGIVGSKHYSCLVSQVLHVPAQTGAERKLSILEERQPR